MKRPHRHKKQTLEAVLARVEGLPYAEKEAAVMQFLADYRKGPQGQTLRRRQPALWDATVRFYRDELLTYPTPAGHRLPRDATRNRRFIEALGAAGLDLQRTPYLDSETLHKQALAYAKANPPRTKEQVMAACYALLDTLKDF